MTSWLRAGKRNTVIIIPIIVMYVRTTRYADPGRRRRSGEWRLAVGTAVISDVRAGGMRHAADNIEIIFHYYRDSVAFISRVQLVAAITIVCATANNCVVVFSRIFITRERAGRDSLRFSIHDLRGERFVPFRQLRSETFGVEVTRHDV